MSKRTGVPVFVVGGLLTILGLLFAWQFLVDPRFSESTTAKEIITGLSRAIYGERCQAQYWIGDRSEAISQARVAFRGQVLKGFMAGNDNGFLSFVTDSELFRNGGDTDRAPDGSGWSVSYSGQGNGRWYVDYLAEDDSRSAYLTAEMTACGRMINVLKTASFKRKKNQGG